MGSGEELGGGEGESWMRGGERDRDRETERDEKGRGYKMTNNHD